MDKNSPRHVAMANRSNADKAEAAAFARSMARSVFGRFYADDRDLAEVRRSMTRAGEPTRPVKP